MALISNEQKFDTDNKMSLDKKNDWPETDNFDIDVDVETGETYRLNGTAESNCGENQECFQPEKVQSLEEDLKENDVEDNSQMQEAYENVALRNSMESINSEDDFKTECTDNDFQGDNECVEVDTVDARKMEDNDMQTGCLEETTKEEVFSTYTKVCCLSHDCPLKTETDLDNEEETNMEKEEYGDVDDDDDEGDDGDDMNNTFSAVERGETLDLVIDIEHGIAVQNNEDTTTRHDQNIETNPDQLKEISDETEANSSGTSDVKTTHAHNKSDNQSHPENDLSVIESNGIDLPQEREIDLLAIESNDIDLPQEPEIDLSAVESNGIDLPQEPEIDLSAIESNGIDLPQEPENDLSVIESNGIDLPQEPENDLSEIESNGIDLPQEPENDLSAIESNGYDLPQEPENDLSAIESNGYDLPQEPENDLSAIESNGIDLPQEPENDLSAIESNGYDLPQEQEIDLSEIESKRIDLPKAPENDLSEIESNGIDLLQEPENDSLAIESNGIDLPQEPEIELLAVNPEDGSKLNEQNMKSRREDQGSSSLDRIELQYNTDKALNPEILNELVTPFENNQKKPEEVYDQENGSKGQEILKNGQIDDAFEDDTEEKHCEDKSENLEETDTTNESTEQEKYSDDFETVDHLVMDEKYTRLRCRNKLKGSIIQILWLLVIMLLVPVLEDKDTTFTKVPYNISSPSDICVCTVGFRGPTCVPPRDDPPDLPPHSNLTRIENQEDNMSSNASVSDAARSAENDSRNVEHDRLENAVSAVSEEPVMCYLNDRNSSSDDDDFFEDDSVENFISLRDDHLDISVRPDSSHSTVPLPSLKKSSSELNQTFDSIVTVREDDTHLPYTGASFKVANERIPPGEIRDRPTLFFQDGDGSTAAAQRGNTNHHVAANNREHTGAECPEFEVDRFLLKLAQDNSLQNIPPGLSDTIIRARTFVWQQWPHISYLTPEQMADAGLFYTGIQDVTMCFYCGKCMNHWKPGDDPRDEHRKVSPGCNFVTLQSDDSAQTQGHQAEDNGAVGTSHAYGTENPISPQGTHRMAYLSSGELPGDSQYMRRCSYAQCNEEQGLQRLQQEPQPWDLQPYGEQNSSAFIGLSNQESSGIQETCGVSCHTEGPSIVNHTVEEALSHLPQQQRRPAGQHRRISRQQGRPVIQDRRFLQQHRRQAGPGGRISRQQGRQALPDGSIVRRGVSGIQPELHAEMTERSDAQAHQTGNTRALSPARNHVSSSMQRIRSAGRIRQTDIDGILDSQVGRMVLYQGYSRTDVARAVRNILRDDGHLTYETIIMALSAFFARRRRQQRARPC